MAYREEFGRGSSSEAAPKIDDGSAEAAAGLGNVAVSEPEPKAKAKSRRKPVLLAVLAAGLAFGAYEGYEWWTNGRFMASTDDA